MNTDAAGCQRPAHAAADRGWSVAFVAACSAVFRYSAVGAALAAQPWWNPTYHYRLPLTFVAPPRDLANQPFVITGRDLYSLSGAARLPCSSLRWVEAGGEQPTQVDERDGTGQFLAAPNGVLNDDDEIVLTVNLSAGKEMTGYLYWDDTPKPRPSVASAIKVEESKGNPFVRLWLTSQRFKLGFNGVGTETPEKNEPGNWGRGTISELYFDGFPLTHIGSSWTFFLPNHPFGSGPGPFRWSEPKVLLMGPVRTLIEIRCDRIEWKDEKGKVYLFGEVVNTFAVYADSPIVDAEMTLRYQATRDSWSAGFAFPMALGKELDLSDVLLVPLAGKAHRRQVTQTELDGWYPTLYSTPLPEEGWFAWVDTAEKIGLAVFYEKMAAIRDRARWVSYRPVQNPEVRLRTTPGGGVENGVTWVHRGLTTSDVMRYPLRLVGIRDDDGEAVRFQFRAWGERITGVARAGFPEASGGTQ